MKEMNERSPEEDRRKSTGIVTRMSYKNIGVYSSLLAFFLGCVISFFIHEAGQDTAISLLQQAAMTSDDLMNWEHRMTVVEQTVSQCKNIGG